MLFKYTPNHTIVQTIKHNQTGKVDRFVVCKFDEKGELETNDEKIIHILQTKLNGCTWEEDRTVNPIDVLDILSDDEIRQLAKKNGIKSWHVINISNLKKKLRAT